MSFSCAIVTPSDAVLDTPATYASFEAWDGQQGVAGGASASGRRSTSRFGRRWVRRRSTVARATGRRSRLRSRVSDEPASFHWGFVGRRRRHRAMMAP
jgi:hypothetical protein